MKLKLPRTKKDSATWLSAGLGVLVPAVFGFQIYHSSIPTNLATWGTVFLLDVIGFLIAFKERRDSWPMQAGWLAGAAVIVGAMLLKHSLWHWGTIETVTSICCAIVIVVWLSVGEVAALCMYMLASYISFVPQGIDYWHAPQPETLWAWPTTIIGCSLAIYGAEKRDFANTFVSWGFLVLNLIAMGILLRSRF